MILVEVQAPAIGKRFDFELDEELQMKLVLEDISVLIAKKEQIACENDRDILLYGLRQETVLNRELSLTRQGIKSGDSLILI